MVQRAMYLNLRHGPQMKLQPRKQPVQARSRALVESILEAAARILLRDGWEGLTTNLVAREAGVSIGSLYQYFPSREAIAVALLRVWIRRVGDRLMETVDSLQTLSAEDGVRRIAADTLLIASDETATYRRLIGHAPLHAAEADFREIYDALSEALADWICRHPAVFQTPDPSLAARTLVMALDGVIDGLIAGRPGLLTSPRLSEQLQRLTRGCLGVVSSETP